MIILASASPRRKAMFERAGLVFEIRPADVDETPEPNEAPEQLVERLAREKAMATNASPEDVVVAADTIVTIDGMILGKPTDVDHAREMVRLLSGNPHQVMTGVCIHRGTPAQTLSWVTTTTVTFKSLNEDDVEWYLANSFPLDKAGAYGIQEHHEFLVESIDGSFDNVVGLPIDEVLEALQSFTNDGQK